MKQILVVVWFLCAAAVGSASAQSFNDGVTAFRGGDYATAFRIWLPMAEQNDAEAQRNIGVMYQQGLGVPQNAFEAARWYRRAADQGHVRAQQNLGVMYEHGTGVPQNFREAVKWYRRSAEGGNVLAKLNLGVLHEQDLPGLPQDLVQTHMWYNLAAAQGNAEAARFRDEVAAVMTGEQVAEAQRLAQEWLEKHPQ